MHYDDDAVWQAYVKGIAPLIRRSVPTPSPTCALRPRRHRGHTLDLHGYTLSEAYSETMEFLLTARAYYGFVTLITGTSGPIRQEFRHWLAGDPAIKRVETMPGGGAFRIYFRHKALQ